VDLQICSSAMAVFAGFTVLALKKYTTIIYIHTRIICCLKVPDDAIDEFARSVE
jgi:hypothetical protein